MSIVYFGCAYFGVFGTSFESCRRFTLFTQINWRTVCVRLCESINGSNCAQLGWVTLATFTFHDDHQMRIGRKQSNSWWVKYGDTDVHIQSKIIFTCCSHSTSLSLLLKQNRFVLAKSFVFVFRKNLVFYEVLEQNMWNYFICQQINARKFSVDIRNEFDKKSHWLYVCKRQLLNTKMLKRNQQEKINQENYITHTATIY